VDTCAGNIKSLLLEPCVGRVRFLKGRYNCHLILRFCRIIERTFEESQERAEDAGRECLKSSHERCGLFHRAGEVCAVAVDAVAIAVDRRNSTCSLRPKAIL